MVNAKMKEKEKNGMDPELLMKSLVLPIQTDIAHFFGQLGMEYHATINVEGVQIEINTPGE